MFENQLQIGTGIYTLPDLSKILHLPYHKVSRWVNKYWDGDLGKEYKRKYSRDLDGSKAVNFHTMVEFYILYLLGEAGVKTRAVLEAHKLLVNQCHTLYPFANKHILESIKTDGKTIYLRAKEDILSLDGTEQFNLEFVSFFFKKLEFGDDILASRFWPMGKENYVVVDPKRQFGKPILTGTNILPETLYDLYKVEGSSKYIAYLYEIEEKLVKDAIQYCEAA